MTKLLIAIGAIVALKFTCEFLYALYVSFVRGGKNLKECYGSWAIVTGSTDGIGKAMAFELAKKGMNLILISRSKDKLDAVHQEIVAKYAKCEVRVLAIDYSDFNQSQRNKVADLAKELDIGVLVNNVGISYPFPKYFHELDDDRVAQLMSLNVDSTTWMTKIVLSGMHDRKRGAIVNIGSAAGVSSSPLLAEYSAAKSYVTAFAKSLDVEYHSKGIHCQCQIALFVATKLAKIRKASLFVASPSGYARAAVASIGYESVISPFWSHKLQIWFLTILPDFAADMIVNNMHQGIRKAGIKKEAKEKAN